MRDVPDLFDLLIVGGGCSGALLVAALARQGHWAGRRIGLVERAPRVGRGVAYGTPSPWHLLNVPAGNMSAFPDEPGHFVRWLQERQPAATADDFAPRALYGAYLESVYQPYAAQLGVTQLHDEALRLDQTPTAVHAHLRTGGVVQAKVVVIASGNYAPHDPPFRGTAGTDRYIGDPWVPGGLAAISAQDDVLLIGTGLTAVDVCLELQNRGHAGRVHAISRRGLLPQAHRPGGATRPLPGPPPEVLHAPRTARGLLRGVRAGIRRAARDGHDWRDVVAALRPITQALWGALPMAERARFLRHVRPYWDAHRHRLAPQVAAAISAARDTGRLAIRRGRVDSITDDGDAVSVRLREHGGAPRELRVGWVINCTGPGSDLPRLQDPLWSSLLRQGLAVADGGGLGVRCAPDGALLHSVDGQPNARLYLLGPLRKADLWEAVAVPELRQMAVTLAQRLTQHLPAVR